LVQEKPEFREQTPPQVVGDEFDSAAGIEFEARLGRGAVPNLFGERIKP
jgi:hypothetical protein